MSSHDFDSLSVIGGPSLTQVDMDDIRQAATWMNRAHDASRQATSRIWDAVMALTLPPNMISAEDVGILNRFMALGDAIMALRMPVIDLAKSADELGRNLLRAAGIYEQVEKENRSFWGQVGAAAGWVRDRTASGLAFGAGFMLGVSLAKPVAMFSLLSPIASSFGFSVPNIRSSPIRYTVFGVLPLLVEGWPLIFSRHSDDLCPEDSDYCEKVDEPGGGGLLGAITRAAGPYSDELIAGLGLGIYRLPFAGSAVAGAAQMLFSGMSIFGDSHPVYARQVSVTSHMPVWMQSGKAGGTIANNLSRLQDVYPEHSSLDGAVAVERITHEDGSQSFVVLIPGTQEWTVSEVHPMDMASNLEMMYSSSPAIVDGIYQALELAGANPADPVILIGHSLGGIAATSLASTALAGHWNIQGVVTVGSPTALIETAEGIPVLHIENDEELVSNLDGKDGRTNPATPDRVTVTRSLAQSSNPLDRQASGSIADAHSIDTHLRTYELAMDGLSQPVVSIVRPMEEHMSGVESEVLVFELREMPESFVRQD